MTEFFPISSAMLRHPLLILEGLIILLSIEYSIFFLNRYLKTDKRKDGIIGAWGFFFLCLASMVLFFMIADFFLVDPDIREVIVNIGYLFMGLGALYFVLNIERELNLKHRIFTIILAVLFAFLLIDYFYFQLILDFVIIEPSTLTYFCWIPFIILLIFYIFKLTSKIKGGKWKINVYGFIIGFFILGTAFFFTADFMTVLTNAVSRLIGDIMILVGISSISILFVGLPSFQEFEWKKHIRKILIIHKSGICLADHDFKEISDDSIGDSQFIAGGLTGISQMITEIVQEKDQDGVKKRLEVMDHKDVKLIFQYGDKLTAVMIVDLNLDIYKFKLNKLIKYIESLYSDLLDDWDPDKVFQFKPVNSIVQRFFS
ncbi:MAG: hypothetical protein GF329_10520 [Candidatus Lokiarchaeota archaeon]|nr:hypothetical protein [Candidatus Lokiarchaeota archaeon]